MDDGTYFASHSPQTVTDSFGTPPGRTIVDRYLEPANPHEDANRYRAPVPYPQPDFRNAFEARTWWQTAIWAAIVCGVILGLIFL